MSNKGELILNKRIGENLKHQREISGLTATAISSFLDITPQQYFKYESGENRISAVKITALVNAYGFNLYDLMPVNKKGLKGSKNGKRDTFRRKTLELSKAQKLAITNIKKAAEQLECYINLGCNYTSREKLLAITRLEEAVMWATKAATRQINVNDEAEIVLQQINEE